MPASVRRLLTWIIVLFGALLVLVGVMDVAIGPDSEALETGVAVADTASRGWSLLYVVIGAAIVALGIRLDRDRAL